MSDSIQKYNNKGLSRFEYIPHFTPSNAESNGLDPKKIIAILLRYKWLVLLFLIAGGVGAWFYADHIEPVYESRGLLMISSNGDL
ncbi:MAG: hypothetical protein GWN00_06195, partial [Aliifodinibius sp.]|nr:hypothetical protein [Fodinibius sp.]NIV10810.1 hypothetical protein [Fodinibius sp.]NIY24409.1 hypothetical protein [Fodinibius sp.]